MEQESKHTEQQFGGLREVFDAPSFKFQISGSEKGFTLVEVLVGAALMITVLTIITTIFLDSIVGQRKAIAFEQSASNARFLMDAFSREIRVSTICGNTGGVRDCYNPDNNTIPGVCASGICSGGSGNGRVCITDANCNFSNELDVIRSSDNVHVSYCIKDYPLAIPAPYANLQRLVNDDDFTQDPCDDTNPAVQVVNSPEVVLLPADSGFFTEGVGQVPAGSVCPDAGTVYDLCQPRVTMVLHVQSITQRNYKERQDVQIQTTLSQRLIDVP